MNRYLSVFKSILLSILCIGTMVNGAVPQLISFQGRLTDGGTPVPNDTILIQLRIYDAPSGGTTLWDNGFRGIPVLNGLFSYLLGDSTALPDNLFASDTVLYLGIKVGVDPEISPRTRLTTMGYAYKALRADTAYNVAGDPFVNETGDFMTGPLSIDFGANATTEYSFRQDGGAATVMELSDNGIVNCQLVADDKGHLILQDASGDPTVILDATGTFGGFLELSKDDGSNLAYLGGSTTGSLDLFDGTSDQTVYLDAQNTSGGRLLLRQEDGTSSVSLTAGTTVTGGVFSMTNPGGSVVIGLEPALTGTDQVQLGANAIDEFEMQDEPGIAADRGPFGSLSGAIQNILLRSINPPGNDSGYVFALGTLRVGFTHTNGTTSVIDCAVSTTSATFPDTGLYTILLPSAAPTGTYVMVATMQGVFKVGSGSDTFYLVAQEGSGNVTVSGANLTLLWFPTAYGTVSASTPLLLENSEVSSADDGFEEKRMQRENEILKGRMKSLEERLSAIEEEISGADDQK